MFVRTEDINSTTRKKPQSKASINALNMHIFSQTKNCVMAPHQVLFSPFWVWDLCLQELMGLMLLLLHLLLLLH